MTTYLITPVPVLTSRGESIAYRLSRGEHWYGNYRTREKAQQVAERMGPHR